MTVSTLTVVPEASASGTAPCAEPTLPTSPLFRSPFAEHQAFARTASPDYPAWLAHIRPAAGCTRPIRLHGRIDTYSQSGIGTRDDPIRSHLVSSVSTEDMPDGVIYKPCGNRRASACSSCSTRYKRDAYQLVRAGLLGGKGVPDTVASHPAVFPTFTAPSFGQVHTRVVKRHVCGNRRDCSCPPGPCHARRDHPVCEHGAALTCYRRHGKDDPVLGTPLCGDCYDYPVHVVWNLQAGELWRRTCIAIERHLRTRARACGIDPDTVAISYGKAAEMQRRAAVHFHAIIRLDGADPTRPGVIIPPPPGLTTADLLDAIEHAKTTVFTTDAHPARPDGWRIGWGEQLVTRVITVAGHGQLTDAMVAAYIAKYATKSTEATGHVSGRLTADSIDLYADPQGTHPERLINACWVLGQAREWRRLWRWAHMFGFGGHFLTKSRRYSVTFTYLRDQRITFRRTIHTGPQLADRAPEHDTVLVVNFLQFVGAGWHTTGDAILANTSAALARERSDTAHTEPVAVAA